MRAIGFGAYRGRGIGGDEPDARRQRGERLPMGRAGHWTLAMVRWVTARRKSWRSLPRGAPLIFSSKRAFDPGRKTAGKLRARGVCVCVCVELRYSPESSVPQFACYISHFLSRLYANQRKPEVTWQNCKQTHLERTDGLLTVLRLCLRHLDKRCTCPQVQTVALALGRRALSWSSPASRIVRSVRPGWRRVRVAACLPAASASGVARGAKHQHQRTEERRGHQHPNSPLFVVYQRLNASAPNHSPDKIR